jgi:hypothetical protein
MTKYRKVTVTRTNPAHVAKLGAHAFDGLYCMWTGEPEIIQYYFQKMKEEGYKDNEFIITFKTGVINPANGIFEAV